MTVTTLRTSSIPAQTTPGFRTTLRSEWTKMRSVRSTWIMVVLAIVLSIGTSALVSMVTGATFDEGSGPWAHDPVSAGLTGLLFSLILLVVLGVTSVTSEYSSRSIQTTFTVNPNRTMVLVARTVIVGSMALIIGSITVPGMFLVSQAVFGSYGLETASITDPDAARHVVAYALAQATVYTMVPFAIAWLLRNTAAAITASFGFLFLPWMLAAVLPTWVQTNVLRYFPDVAVDSLASYTDSDAPTYLTQAPAIAVVILWLVGLLTVAAVVLNRRDV